MPIHVPLNMNYQIKCKFDILPLLSSENIYGKYKNVQVFLTGSLHSFKKINYCLSFYFWKDHLQFFGDVLNYTYLMVNNR